MNVSWISLLVIFFISHVEAQVFVPFSFWGCGNVTPAFVDAASTDFTGTMTNVAWNGTALALTVGQTSGTYLSRPYDKTTKCVFPAAVLQPFVNLSWGAELPFNKELPATSELTTEYSSLASSTLLNNIVGIWHLNDTSAAASGTSVPAQVGPNGVVRTSGTLGYSAGKLNNAANFDGSDIIDIPYQQSSATQYTIATWIRTTSTGNNVFVENRGTGPGRSLTLGVGTNPGGCGTGRVSFGVDSNAIYIGKCTTGTVHNGIWRHIVGTWSGTSGTAVASAQFSIYVDGVAAATTNTSVGSVNAPLTGQLNTKFGRHDPWGVNLNGDMDEVAIWTRALTATEVAQLYRRGGNRLKFQMRSCISPSCGDNPTWIGPDGSASTFFSELNNNTSPETGLGTPVTTSATMVFADFPFVVLPNARFFQYQINFESDSTTLVPTVKRISTSY